MHRPRGFGWIGFCFGRQTRKEVSSGQNHWRVFGHDAYFLRIRLELDAASTGRKMLDNLLASREEIFLLHQRCPELDA